MLPVNTLSTSHHVYRWDTCLQHSQQNVGHTVAAEGLVPRVRPKVVGRNRSRRPSSSKDPAAWPHICAVTKLLLLLLAYKQRCAWPRAALQDSHTDLKSGSSPDTRLTPWEGLERSGWEDQQVACCTSRRLVHTACKSASPGAQT